MIRSFSGKTPKVAESAYVNEMAYVVADVEIGEGSSVWPFAVLRGDGGPIRLGANVIIEDNCVLHSGTPIVIGDNVTVGHGAIIHCHTIGNNVLIGNGAIVLDGVEIGDNCIVSAGAVVPPRAKIPAGSMAMGVPAEIRPLTPEQIEHIGRYGQLYGPRAKAYKEQGL